MEQAFRKDLEKSKRIRLEEWRKRSLALRLKQWTARMWEYWL